MRVSIESLMDNLRNDPTLQNALSGDAWNRLAELHVKYNAGMPRRALVDGVSAIVGTMKLLSMVKQLSMQQHKRTFPAPLKRISSNGSASSGTPGTPGGAEVYRILNAPTRPPSGRAAKAPPLPSPEITQEVSNLVHAWHCKSSKCDLTKCRLLKAHLERVEAHIAVCESEMDECKACQVWLALQRTQPVNSPVPNQ